MSDFYFNPDGSDELYHYGVPGMRWGHRKARILYAKADIAGGVAKDYKRISKEYAQEGNTKKAKKFEKAANKAKSKEANYKYKAEEHTKYGRLDHKAQRSKESSKEWKEMADYARSKGNTKRAIKFEEYAKKEAEAAKRYKQKSEAVVRRMEKRAKNMSVSSKAVKIAARLGKDRLEEQLNKDGYQKHKKFTGTITDGYQERKRPGAVKY